MDIPFLYPLHESAGFLVRHCKLLPLSGTGTVASHGDTSHPLVQMFKQAQQALGQLESASSEGTFDGTFLFPAAGDCLFFLHGAAAGRLSRNFGEGLTLRGDSPDGEFELFCPRYYVRAVAAHKEQPAWAIAEPINGPVTITYGESRSIRRVSATINNFDFEYGNVPPTKRDPIEAKNLRVEAAGQVVEFTWRAGHQELRRLVDAEVLRTASLTTFSFSAWSGASEGDLTQFAYDIASLCAVVARQHTGVPVLSFLDKDGRPVKRIAGNPVESPFRHNYVIPFLHFDNGLPQLSREGFAKHVRMQRSDLWRRLPFLCAGIEDSPYLEQKFATLMAAVELIIRSSLVEGGQCSAEESEKLTLPELLGAARAKLGWTIPNHYTAKERHRRLRNAVAHGGRLPGDIKGVRHDFDKWHLFLLRRLLVRLGYTGEVASPEAGYASSSAVNDFSEEHNAFGA
jgi:hypothetical protein